MRFLWLYVLPRILFLVRIMYGTSNVHTTEESGANLAWVASSPSTSGVYYEGKKEIKSSVVSYEVDKQEDLWSWTVNHVAKDEQERQDFQVAK
jgi:hypothetical protein